MTSSHLPHGDRRVWGRCLFFIWRGGCVRPNYILSGRSHHVNLFFRSILVVDHIVRVFLRTIFELRPKILSLMEVLLRHYLFSHYLNFVKGLG